MGAALSPDGKQPADTGAVYLHRGCAVSLARHLLNDVDRYDRDAERRGWCR